MERPYKDQLIQNEEWRDIPGYEGFYKVSSHGRVVIVKPYNKLFLIFS